MNYPVNPDSRWAVYNTDSESIEKSNIRWPRKDLMEIQGLADNLVMLELADDDQPSFDEATQSLVSNDRVVDLNSNKYLRTWRIEDKSAKEILAEKVSLGFLVEPEGFVIALEEHDQNAFTRLLTLVSINEMPDQAYVQIADKSEVLHNVTVGRLKEILTQYGLYYQQLWTESAE